MRDIIIIGAALAGLTSAIYVTRKKLDSVVITEKIGGQSLMTGIIENYPGFKKISGIELIQKIREQAEDLGVEIKENLKVDELKQIEKVFEVKTEQGEIFKARALIIATGKKPRLLNVPGEKELTGKGVSYCSVCDAPMFGGKDVVVVGSGNVGLEAAMDLSKYAKKIYVLEFGPKIMGDEITQKKIHQEGRTEFIVNAATKEIKGKDFVESLIYINRKTGEQKKIKTEGVLVSIGHIPNSDFVKNFIKLNTKKEIIINQKTNQTSVDGVFAAGDVTDVLYKQCVIAAGEGAKAALSAYSYLQNE